MGVHTIRSCLYTRYRFVLAFFLGFGIFWSFIQIRRPMQEEAPMTKRTLHFNLELSQQRTSPQTYFTRQSLKMNISNNNHGAHIDNMTIVTAFFDLGSFRKGTSLTVTTQTYINWVKTFKYMNNSLVVYTDSVIFSDIFRELRRGMEQRTKIVFVNRTQLWAFQIHNAIKTIYSQEGYPKHFPNTVLPAYSCTQHSKYEVVADAVRKQYFKSKFYAWLDIGYFRDIFQSNKYFTLRPLDDFDRNRLAVNLVYPSLSLNVSYKSIVYNNQVWVGGGMFIGTADVLLALEKEYKRAVMFLLDKRLISTDQQVILSMYSVQGRKDLNTTLQLQVYSRRQNETNLKNGNPWFYLGYKCLNFAST